MSDPRKLPPAAAIGEVIGGKYRVEGVLGSGGMGVVLAATHLDLDRRVAVKVMRAEPNEHPGAVQRLLLEAKLAAQFQSEHVCKVLDVGTLSGGAPYVVMEYLEGADLAELLARDGVFEVSAAVDLLLEACEALAEAHAAEVVHRDLKPSNLFVSKRLDGASTLKVLDFGISKRVGPAASQGDLTNPSAALGSPYYMAPEQMLSARDVDCRADIWAVGAILFELLSGARPFEGQTLPEVCAAVMSSPPKHVSSLRPEVPSKLAEVIERCLQKEPQARFQDVAQLAAALAPFGSERAAQSCGRIERILGSRNPSLRALERALATTGDAPAQGLGTLTGGAATAAIRRETSSAAKRGWLAAAVVAMLAVAVVALWRRAPAPHLPAALPTAANVEARPTTAAAAAAADDPSPAPSADPVATSELPPAAPSSSATPAATARAPKSNQAAKSPATTAQARVTAAKPESADADPASSADAGRARAPVDAWDTSTFGPRR